MADKPCGPGKENTVRYNKLKDLTEAEHARALPNLIALREQLSRDIPPKDAEDHLLLATWNIRDLAKTNRRGYGERLAESHIYIAEVLSRFDFVAVQEVNELDEWEHIMYLLGPHWHYIATDVTDPGLGGNGERLTFLFDARKVSFQNIAGEVVLPANLLISGNVEAPEGDDEATVEVGPTQVGKQFARTPFTALFQAGWFKFEICTVHIYYGAETGPKLEQRVNEIKTIAAYFGRRAESDFKDDRSLILTGDMNVVNPQHKTMQALLSAGFEIPEPLRELPTNIAGEKYYDQIAFRLQPGGPAYFEPEPGNGSQNAGAFNIFERVFRQDQFAQYQSDVASTPNGQEKTGEVLASYYLDWRTYQFSDHRPLWVRIRANDSARYLASL